VNRHYGHFGYLTTLIALSLCIGCAVKGDELKLPCGLTGLRWGLTEAELTSIRPGATWNNSIEAYGENLDTCLPFVTNATYRVSCHWYSWQKTLDSVWLGREIHYTTPEQVEALVPGFIGGCALLWGSPDGVEVFTRPKLSSLDYWNVGLWWTRDWGEVYSYYSSPLALAKYGDDKCATISILVSRAGGEDFRAWTRGVSDPKIVARYFAGIPSADRLEEPVLH
jgi:hypothetical protein